MRSNWRFSEVWPRWSRGSASSAVVPVLLPENGSSLLFLYELKTDIPDLLCDNPHQIHFLMRLARFLLIWMCGMGLAGAVVWTQPPPAFVPRPGAPLALVGGTVVDVTDWGHSAKDLQDAVVLLRDGRVIEVGPRSEVAIPKGIRVIDCTGKYLIPGLVDGYAGLRNQGQANAFLYMGVTTVVSRNDADHGPIDLFANPGPHIYSIDSIGLTDNWSLLASVSAGRQGSHSATHSGGQAGYPDWSVKLREGNRPAELSPEDTARQVIDTAHIGTRVLWLGPRLTAVNAQWIIARAHQMGMVTYGEFLATPYKVALEAGVDALPRMGRYEVGVVPDELQRPLVDDRTSTATSTAYDYAERLPPTDLHMRTYARQLAAHHAALMPIFSLYYLELPGHRNLWKEPAAKLLDPSSLTQPSNRATGELSYSLANWARKLPAATQHWMEDSQRKKAAQSAQRLWQINQAIFAAYPHYLAASGAPAKGTMPGISMHTELEMLVRLGLSPREALAAATNNYALQFDWNELGLIAPGRRADILVVDGDPTQNIWNARHISTLIMEGNVIDREGLLNLRK